MLEQIKEIKEKLEKALDCFTFAWDGTHDFECQVEKAEVLIQEALALIEEKEKTGIWVEIPEPINGYCNPSCLFYWTYGFKGKFCRKGYMVKETGKSGSQCPRYKEEGNGKEIIYKI
jgi:hypothetical protein